MLLVFIVYEKRSLRIYRLSSKKRGEGEKECPEIRVEKEGGGFSRVVTWRSALSFRDKVCLSDHPRFPTQSGRIQSDYDLLAAPSDAWTNLIISSLPSRTAGRRSKESSVWNETIEEKKVEIVLLKIVGKLYENCTAVV